MKCVACFLDISLTLGTWCFLAMDSMRSRVIVVSNEFFNCSLQMKVADHDPVIETFGTDSAYSTFRKCIGL